VSTLLLVLATFAASAVEMVEALTIVLAVGVTRGWRATAWGGVTALVALTAIVVVLGPAVARLPLAALRIGVGALLLVFGLQWLRKAILRASGYKAQHDEDAIYREEVAEVSAVATTTTFDWYAFTIAFKGVFLEGLEVAFIVITFGSSQGRIGLAALGALAALVVVATVGAIVHAPLSRVPENWLKFGVGVMLTSFGTFWSAEGAGVDWPGGEVCLVAVIAYVAVLAIGLTRLLAVRSRTVLVPGPAETS
jgi:uncharacterized membrane protein